jgi:hypothetical protein
MPKFQTPNTIMATVDINAGDVRIVAGDRTDTVVEVQPRNPSDPADVRAAEEANIDFSDGRLTVKTPKDWKQHLPFIGPSGGGPAVEVTIALPSGSRVDGNTGLGIFRCEGRLGECRLKTAAGSLVLDQAGAADLRTGFGDIAADLVTGELTAFTGSGEVRIGVVRGNARLRNSNGAIKLGSVDGDLQAKTANGSIAIDAARKSVNAKTANGGIRIGEVARDIVEVDTAAGEISIGIREGTAAWLDLNAPGGNVRNALDAVGSPEPADEKVEIRAHTSFGDIVIHRSAGASAATDTTETIE